MTTAAATTQSLALPVLGMSCAACQHHVEAALAATPGVHSAHVDLVGNRASVVFDPTVAGPEQLIAAIRAAGYEAVLPRTDGSSAAKHDTREEANADRKALITLVAGVAAMGMSMPLSSGTAGEMGQLDHAMMRLLPWLFALPANPLRWALLAVTVALAAWTGRGIYASAARGLWHGATNMNTLVSLGTGVALAYSAYATLWPAPGRDVYFDAVLLILGFLLLGKALEGRAKRRAMAALEALANLSPVTARRLRDGVQKIVPLEEIVTGDRVLILPGERFPVDAVIVEGRTTVDESMLTGESTPLAREAGGRVLAGALNYDGAVTVKVELLGEATVLAQMTRMVQQAQGSRAPMERLADRASAIFVPVVLGLALLTFAAWLAAAHSLPLALAATVAVLVIACPCAMGLAVPAALTVAVGRAAQLGVLYKGGEALERLARLDVVVLDKTGTLTAGRPVLEAVHTAAGFAESDLLRWAAAAEERSNHPLAHAVVDAAKARGLAWPAAEAVQVLPGRGVSAKVEGRDCLLGNAALFAEWGIALPTDLTAAGLGVTRLWMAVDGQAGGCFDARDRLRPDAAAAVAGLRQMGLQVMMLTGDTLEAAKPIAQEAKINQVEAGLDPAGKLARIRELQKSGQKVAMVGDGINDAAALAQADAGIAMGGGAELAQEAGDALLVSARPGGIVAAVGLARATVRVMRENLIWAVAYNVVGIPLAAGVLYPAFHILLSPWVAAAAMALSSLSVLGNSLRLRGWRIT